MSNPSNQLAVSGPDFRVNTALTRISPVDNVSKSAISGSTYIQKPPKINVATPMSTTQIVARDNVSTTSGLGWCGQGSQHLHYVSAKDVPLARPRLGFKLDTCAPSALDSCGLGTTSYGDGVLSATELPNPVLHSGYCIIPSLELCGADSLHYNASSVTRSKPVLAPDICTILDPYSCGIDAHDGQQGPSPADRFAHHDSKTLYLVVMALIAVFLCKCSSAPPHASRG
jgi:hypothetical protein